MSLSQTLRRQAVAALRQRGIEVTRVSGSAPTHPHFVDQPFDQPGSRPRVLVNTQPKAGTYLYAAIVEHLGFHHSYLHLAPDRLQAYDPTALEHGLKNPRAFDVPIPIAESRKLIRLGELAVAHLSFNQEMAAFFRHFKIILIRRELRAALLSWARMLLYSGRFGHELTSAISAKGVSAFINAQGTNKIEQACSIANWEQEPNVVSLRYEDLQSDPLSQIRLIRQHLDLEDMDDSRIYEAARSTPTLTHSSAYPKLCWDEYAEEAFISIGGIEANRRLGYEEPR